MQIGRAAACQAARKALTWRAWTTWNGIEVISCTGDSLPKLIRPVGNVRVILTESDQTAVSGLWVYGGDRPEIGQVISVESTLGAGNNQARVWRIGSGEPYLVFATIVEN
jgi:hypothetical protein